MMEEKIKDSVPDTTSRKSCDEFAWDGLSSASTCPLRLWSCVWNDQP